MSKKAVLEFSQEAQKNQQLKEELKVITTWQEIIKRGRKRGYNFTREDIDLVNADFEKAGYQEKLQADSLNQVKGENADKTGIYHYEFSLSQIPGGREIAQVVERLKIKPNTVDINRYESSFREDDFNFYSISPASPEFKSRYEEIINSFVSEDTSLPEPDNTTRQSHLINLDHHVEHPGYDDYFTAKLTLARLLTRTLDGEVKFSGSFWYPPKGYRLWHTNEEQPGWRMYIIDFDSLEQIITGQSFFRYMNPVTKKLVDLEDKPKLVRFFKIEKEQDQLFWHCIVNNSQANRWSFGFTIPDHWMDKVLPGLS